jgi:hypothetical protein
MSKRPPAALPDMDDTEFAAKLRPLGDTVLPKPRHPNIRISEESPPRIAAAERMEKIERVRGPKRRFEYLIPVRVGEALAQDAAAHGKSAATRLLEVLRDAGYPVIQEDFVDLRKRGQ